MPPYKVRGGQVCRVPFFNTKTLFPPFRIILTKSSSHPAKSDSDIKYQRRGLGQNEHPVFGPGGELSPGHWPMESKGTPLNNPRLSEDLIAWLPSPVGNRGPRGTI